MQQIVGAQRHGKLRHVGAAEQIDARGIDELGEIIILGHDRSGAQAAALLGPAALEVEPYILHQIGHAMEPSGPELRCVAGIGIELDDRIDLGVDGGVGRKGGIHHLERRNLLAGDEARQAEAVLAHIFIDPHYAPRIASRGRRTGKRSRIA